MKEELLSKLTRDMKGSTATMTKDEARLLVGTYYLQQENRLRADGQIRSIKDQPHAVLSWASESAMFLEKQLESALKYFAESQHMGRWAMNTTGIGPVIAAGLVAHINTEPPPPTVGHIWRFAGLDPTSKWEKGQKRPWNAALKCLCYKIGESFVKVQNKESDFYGKIYAERKALEWNRNLAGEFSDQASTMMKQKQFGSDTTALPFYSGKMSPKRVREMLANGGVKQGVKGTNEGDEIPMLPPGHIHARARRYAVKLFLSHWHGEAYQHHFNTPPPLPYPIAHLGHAHLILATTRE